MQRRPGIPDDLWSVLGAVSVVLIAVVSGLVSMVILTSCG